RARGRHGVPRAAAAREHVERVVPARAVARHPARSAAGGAVKPFANEPVLELRRGSVRESLLGALREVDAQLPLRTDGRDTFTSTDPGKPDRVVAVAERGTPETARAAVGAAAEAAPKWAATAAEQRADALLKAAAHLRERRLTAAAVQVRECAKPWGEADA